MRTFVHMWITLWIQWVVKMVIEYFIHSIQNKLRIGSNKQLSRYLKNSLILFSMKRRLHWISNRNDHSRSVGGFIEKQNNHCHCSSVRNDKNTDRMMIVTKRNRRRSST